MQNLHNNRGTGEKTQRYLQMAAMVKNKENGGTLIEEEQGKLPSDDMSVMEVSPEMKNSSS